jgi:hypothetical protein
MKKIVTTLAALALGAAMLAGCAVSTTPSGSPASGQPSQAAPANSVPANIVPATTAPAAPAMTVSQQQAVQSAQSYLSMGSGFSLKGLMQQLTSSSGEGFSKADAAFAIRHLHPNWDAQAVDSAKGYLSMGGFSRTSLIQQLTSSSGEGFTLAQALYAVKAVGL